MLAGLDVVVDGLTVVVLVGKMVVVTGGLLVVVLVDVIQVCGSSGVEKAAFR